MLVRTLADKGLGAQGARNAGISLWLCPTGPPRLLLELP